MGGSREWRRRRGLERMPEMGWAEEVKGEGEGCFLVIPL